MIKCRYYGILPLFGPIQLPGIDLFHVGHIFKVSFQSLISSELFQGCCFQLMKSKLKSKPLFWLSTLVLGIPEFQLSSRDLSFFGQVHIPSHWLWQRPVRDWSWFWILFLWFPCGVGSIRARICNSCSRQPRSQLENGRCLKAETTFELQGLFLLPSGAVFQKGTGGTIQNWIQILPCQHPEEIPA